jgi:hypothetical protein
VRGLRRLRLPLVWACGVAVGSLVAPTFAAFSGTTQNDGSSVAAHPDWVAPSATASVIRKSAGGLPGFIKQGGTYYVYASVSDSGNPASGVSTVTANVSSITSGQTATALSIGSWTVDNVSYNYRSAQLTANAVLVGGSKTYALTMTDAGGNSQTQSGFSVVVDNIVPAGTDIQTENVSGGTQGRPELGDTVMYTFTERIEPDSLLGGWNGGSTNVVLRFLNGGGGGAAANDLVQIWNAANTSQLPLGEIQTRGNYVSDDVTFGASGTPSTMVQIGSVVTITLGTASSTSVLTNGTDTQLWTPSSVATDLAGNNCDVSVVTELGVADPDF